jgi:hypothetical protein
MAVVLQKPLAFQADPDQLRVPLRQIPVTGNASEAFKARPFLKTWHVLANL